MSKEMKFITLEEHFLADPGSLAPIHTNLYHAMGVLERLLDLGSTRLTEMQNGQIAMQVISHVPGDFSPSVCRAANDKLSTATWKNPDRLAGFAALPMHEPQKAANELERCVVSLGFVGALIDNHLDDGTYYDDERFWEVFSRAERLCVPLYLHPTYPDELSLHKEFSGNYDNVVTTTLGTAGWGWHSSTALHILRLYAAGVFERYPRLQLVIGHSGEGLSFFFERLEALSRSWSVGRQKAQRTRFLREVFDTNIWITTSGMFSLSPMACLVRNIKPERIIFSVDYPFSDNKDGCRFMQDLKQSGLVTADQFEGIAYKNAEALLNVKPNLQSQVEESVGAAV